MKSYANDKYITFAYGASFGTLFTVFKPSTGGVKFSHVPIGETNTVRYDGTVETSIDAWTEYLDLKFDGMTLVEYSNLMIMMKSGYNQIRIHMEPSTDFDTYETYTLIYNKIKSSPDHYALSRTGVSGVSLRFARAYA